MEPLSLALWLLQKGTSLLRSADRAFRRSSRDALIAEAEQYFIRAREAKLMRTMALDYGLAKAAALESDVVITAAMRET